MQHLRGIRPFRHIGSGELVDDVDRLTLPLASEDRTMVSIRPLCLRSTVPPLPPLGSKTKFIIL